MNEGLAAEQGLSRQHLASKSQLRLARQQNKGSAGNLATRRGFGDINKGLATEQKGSAEATLGKQESGELGRGGRAQQQQDNDKALVTGVWP